MNLQLASFNKTSKLASKKEYKELLSKYQRRLLSLQQLLFKEKIALIIAMEGWDAAGKGGAIKRATEKLDPRGLKVYPISAPAPHEKKYHYLQRFWRKLPQYGEIAIFDRSWYGRVLVERVEKFAADEEWQRAYSEINDFERQLTDDRYILLKFWIHISKEEQLQRFKARKEDPLKQWKLTEEDWRNRECWDLYEEAAETMFAETNHSHAPWYIIAGNDKKFARVSIIEKIISHVERQLTERGIDLPDYSLFE